MLWAVVWTAMTFAILAVLIREAERKILEKTEELRDEIRKMAEVENSPASAATAKTSQHQEGKTGL